MVKSRQLPIPARTCGVCGVQFQPKRKDHVVCSMKCFRALRERQREADFAVTAAEDTTAQTAVSTATQTTTGTRTCHRCGGSFSGDPLFVTCPSCRRPSSVVTGGCHRWGGANYSVGSVKKIVSDTLE